MFQCHSPKSSHPLPLPQGAKDCSIRLCLFAVSHTVLLLPSLTTAAAVLSLSKRSAFPLLPLLMVSHTGVIFQKYRLSPKVHSAYLCLFCCLAYRVIIAIFLNSIYMC